MKVTITLKCILGLLVLNCLAFSAPSKIHKYHTSLSRIDYNQAEKNIEITIQLFTHDLVSVLESKNKQKIDLGKTPKIDELISNYLEQNFILRNKKGEILNFKWVGKELEVDTLYIYVEIPSAESPQGFLLQNTIFFESFPEQTNLIIARFGGKKIDMLFKVGDKTKMFPVFENK